MTHVAANMSGILLPGSADPTGRAAWLNAMLGGMSEAQVVIDFMTAPEYTFRHPDARLFVTGLYTDILGMTEVNHSALFLLMA